MLGVTLTAERVSLAVEVSVWVSLEPLVSVSVSEAVLLSVLDSVAAF